VPNITGTGLNKSQSDLVPSLPCPHSALLAQGKQNESIVREKLNPRVSFFWRNFAKKRNQNFEIWPKRETKISKFEKEVILGTF
jgi:hypothetical protein